VRDVAAWLPLIVIGDMLGVDPADHARLLGWSEAMILGTGATTMERIDGAARAFDEYVAYQRRVLANRRAHPRDDLVSVLVHAEVDGERLDDDELLMETLHPAARAALARNPTAIPTAVEEMLRWVSPIQNMARTGPPATSSSAVSASAPARR
jgi:cytochrome P450 family 142 subfamily A polypeptide 1